jgi:nitroreductase
MAGGNFTSARLKRTDLDAVLDELPEPARILAGLLTARFSCRAYLPTPVPRRQIEHILQLAQLTASWANIQPWQVIITEGEGTRRFAEALYDHAQNDPMGMDFDFPPPPGYQGVYDERRKECGIQLYTSLGIQRGDRQAGLLQALENFHLFGAPHAAIITTDRDTGLYGAVDTGGYVANFMLAAQSLGIATIPQASLARYGSFVRSHFNLPQERAIFCGLSFGYADADHPANGFRTFRADPEEVADFRGQ